MNYADAIAALIDSCPNGLDEDTLAVIDELTGADPSPEQPADEVWPLRYLRAIGHGALADLLMYADWVNKGAASPTPKGTPRFTWYNPDTGQTRIQGIKPGSRQAGGQAAGAPVPPQPGAPDEQEEAKTEAQKLAGELKGVNVADLDADKVKALGDNLLKMTLEDVRKFQQEVGLDAAWAKRAPRGKIAAAILAHVTGQEMPKPEKAAAPVKPKMKALSEEELSSLGEEIRSSLSGGATPENVKGIFDKLLGVNIRSIRALRDQLGAKGTEAGVDQRKKSGVVQRIINAVSGKAAGGGKEPAPATVPTPEPAVAAETSATPTPEPAATALPEEPVPEQVAEPEPAPETPAAPETPTAEAPAAPEQEESPAEGGSEGEPADDAKCAEILKHFHESSIGGSFTVEDARAMAGLSPQDFDATMLKLVDEGVLQGFQDADPIVYEPGSGREHEAIHLDGGTVLTGFYMNEDSPAFKKLLGMAGDATPEAPTSPEPQAGTETPAAPVQDEGGEFPLKDKEGSKLTADGGDIGQDKKQDLAEATKRELQRHMERFSQAIDRSPDLSDEQRQRYREATESILGRLTPRAMELFTKGSNKDPVFYASQEKMRDALIAAAEKKGWNTVADQLRKLKGPPGGAYVAGGLILDGALGNDQIVTGDFAPPPGHVEEDVYAHEFAHAIDGKKSLSSSAGWVDAFNAELTGGKLTKYGATKPSEGFAEFGRLLLSGRYDPAQVKAAFPKSFAFWVEQGIVDDVDADASKGEPKLEETFDKDKRVELGQTPDDPSHADVLLPKTTDGAAGAAEAGGVAGATTPQGSAKPADHAAKLMDLAAADDLKAFQEYEDSLSPEDKALVEEEFSRMVAEKPELLEELRKAIEAKRGGQGANTPKDNAAKVLETLRTGVSPGLDEDKADENAVGIDLKPTDATPTVEHELAHTEANPGKLAEARRKREEAAKAVADNEAKTAEAKKKAASASKVPSAGKSLGEWVMEAKGKPLGDFSSKEQKAIMAEYEAAKNIVPEEQKDAETQEILKAVGSKQRPPEELRDELIAKHAEQQETRFASLKDGVMSRLAKGETTANDVRRDFQARIMKENPELSAEEAKEEAISDALFAMNRLEDEGILEVVPGTKPRKYRLTESGKKEGERSSEVSGHADRVRQELEAKAGKGKGNTGESGIKDATQLNRSNVRSVWESMRDELVAHDPKLSPNRAGELAAARLRNQIGNKLADIEDRARSGNITPEEEAFYDDVHVGGWQFGRELEMMSGTRTMAADMDDPYVQRSLDADPLPDNVTPQRRRQEELRRQADETAAQGDKERAAKAGKGKGKTTASTDQGKGTQPGVPEAKKAAFDPATIANMKPQLRDGGQAKTPRDAAIMEWQFADDMEKSLNERLNRTSLRMIKDTPAGQNEIRDLKEKLDKLARQKAKSEKLLASTPEETPTPDVADEQDQAVETPAGKEATATAEIPELEDYLDDEWAKIPKNQRKKLDMDQWNTMKRQEWENKYGKTSSTTDVPEQAETTEAEQPTDETEDIATDATDAVTGDAGGGEADDTVTDEAWLANNMGTHNGWHADIEDRREKPATAAKLFKGIEGTRFGTFGGMAAKHGWFTDGKILFEMDDPKDQAEAKKVADVLRQGGNFNDQQIDRFFNNAQNILMQNKAGQPLTDPVAVRVSNGTRQYLLRGQDGKQTVVDAGYYDTLRARFPNAEFVMNAKGPNEAVLIFDKGSRVGLLMPIVPHDKDHLPKKGETLPAGPAHREALAKRFVAVNNPRDVSVGKETTQGGKKSFRVGVNYGTDKAAHVEVVKVGSRGDDWDIVSTGIGDKGLLVNKPIAQGLSKADARAMAVDLMTHATGMKDGNLTFKKKPQDEGQTGAPEPTPEPQKTTSPKPAVATGKPAKPASAKTPGATKPVQTGTPMSTGTVAKFCQVAPRTISKWVDSGKLPATIDPVTKNRTVKPEDLVAFMQHHGMEVPADLAGVQPSDAFAENKAEGKKTTSQQDKPEKSPSGDSSGGTLQSIQKKIQESNEGYLAASDVAVELLHGKLKNQLPGILQEAGIRPDAADSLSAHELGEFLHFSAKYGHHEEPDARDHNTSLAKSARDKINERVERATGKVFLEKPKLQGEVADRHIAEQLTRATSSLPPDKAKSYRQSIDRAVSKMPRVARDRAASHLKKISFARDLNELSDMMAESTYREITDPANHEKVLKEASATLMGQERKDFMESIGTEAGRIAKVKELADKGRQRYKDLRGNIGGGYNPITGELLVDGKMPYSTHAGPADYKMERGDSQSALYAHELAHALDGPGLKLSGSHLWNDIWRDEISGAKLTEYADTATFEGFAEFGRLVYGQQVDLKQVEKMFPKAAKFFKDHDIWPEN